MKRFLTKSCLCFIFGLFPLNANAQYCGSTTYSKPSYGKVYNSKSSYSTSYVKPSYNSASYIENVIIQEVAVPVAVPVLIPSTVFQYLPAIVPTAAIPVTPVNPVTTAPTTPVAPTVSSVPSVAEMERIINARVDKLVQERLKYIMPGDKGPPPLIMPTPSNDQVTTRPANGPGPGPSNNPSNGADADINVKVAQILANKCARCHSQGVKTSGNVTLFVKNGEQVYFQPSVSKADIWNVIKPPTPMMPPNGADPIKGEELSLLQSWYNSK